MATDPQATAPAVHTHAQISLPAGRASYVLMIGAGGELLNAREMAEGEIVISRARLDEIAEMALALANKAGRVVEGGGA